MNVVSGGALKYTNEDKGEWVTLVTFDCRGMEPTDWDPRDGFVAKAESGTNYADVDLNEDWYGLSACVVREEIMHFEYSNVWMLLALTGAILMTRRRFRLAFTTFNTR